MPAHNMSHQFLRNPHAGNRLVWEMHVPAGRTLGQTRSGHKQDDWPEATPKANDPGTLLLSARAPLSSTVFCFVTVYFSSDSSFVALDKSSFLDPPSSNSIFGPNFGLSSIQCLLYPKSRVRQHCPTELWDDENVLCLLSNYSGRAQKLAFNLVGFLLHLDGYNVASTYQIGQDRYEKQVIWNVTVFTVKLWWVGLGVDGGVFQGFLSTRDPIFQNHHLETYEPTMEVIESYSQRYDM